jgi:hypothetical protein
MFPLLDCEIPGLSSALDHNVILCILEKGLKVTCKGYDIKRLSVVLCM